jgi:hypothetical protein
VVEICVEGEKEGFGFVEARAWMDVEQSEVSVSHILCLNQMVRTANEQLTDT